MHGIGTFKADTPTALFDLAEGFDTQRTVRVASGVEELRHGGPISSSACPWRFTRLRVWLTKSESRVAHSGMTSTG